MNYYTTYLEYPHTIPVVNNMNSITYIKHLLLKPHPHTSSSKANIMKTYTILHTMVEWLSNTMTFEMETESENSYYVY